MSDKLMNLIKSAIEKDGFLFIGILGDKGFGKSVLTLNLVYEVLGDWQEVLKHVIFTINDFNNIPYRSDLTRYVDGRVKVVAWDDFGLHTSSYGFTKRGERDQLIDFVENFEVVREDVAVLIVNCATWDLIPPKLRDNAHVFIQMTKRGKGEIWVKTRGWLFLRKDYKKIGEIESLKIPDGVYSQYRAMKRRAKAIKEKMALIRQKEKAKQLAEELTDEELRDMELLSAYGIYDLHDNLTEFGKLVMRYIHERKQIERELFNLAKIFRKAIPQREFERLGLDCGLQRDKLRVLYKLVVQRLIDKNGNVLEVMR
jgi:hypothetical protein